MTELVEPLPDIPDLEFIEPFGSEMGNDVQAGEQLVFLACLRREIGPRDLFQPVGNEITQAWHV